MRVRLRTILAGPEGTLDAGSVADLPDAQAAELLAGGYAEPIDPPAPERTVAPAADARTAVLPAGRKASKPNA